MMATAEQMAEEGTLEAVTARLAEVEAELATLRSSNLRAGPGGGSTEPGS